VYQIAPDQALVQTVDFFTPVVDDPYVFGQIAATNALSDVYAMGGPPVTSLAWSVFPKSRSRNSRAHPRRRPLENDRSRMHRDRRPQHSRRRNQVRLRGHRTHHPKKVLANAGAKPGDALIFTKALGTGVISTAIKKGKAEPAWIDAAVQSMTTLNKQAAEVIQQRRIPHSRHDRCHRLWPDRPRPRNGARKRCVVPAASRQYSGRFRARSIAFARAIFPAASTTTATSPNVWWVTRMEFPTTCERFSSILRPREALLISVASEDSAQLSSAPSTQRRCRQSRSAKSCPTKPLIADSLITK
jgi:hypothetical protein